VKQYAHALWPGDGDVQPFAPTGRSSAPDLARPALIQLRLRAIVGVSARAEILRLLLAEPAGLHGTVELASAAAYGKSNAAAALDLLAMASVVETRVSGNQFRHRLARRSQLVSLLEPLPLHFPDWAARFRIIHAVLLFADSAPRAGMPRAVEARRTIRSLEPDLRRLDVGNSVRIASGKELANAFERWSVGVLEGWAGDEGTARA
jgi:hypothetical protein